MVKEVGRSETHHFLCQLQVGIMHNATHDMSNGLGPVSKDNFSRLRDSHYKDNTVVSL